MTTSQLTIDHSPLTIIPPFPPSWGWEDFSSESTPNLLTLLNRTKVDCDDPTGWIDQYLRRHRIERELARRGVAT